MGSDNVSTRSKHNGLPVLGLLKFLRIRDVVMLLLGAAASLTITLLLYRDNDHSVVVMNQQTKVLSISPRGQLVIGMALPLTIDQSSSGQFLRLPANIRRVWMDVGTHARAGNTRPFLDKFDDLLVIGFEPMRYQWGEISTINFDAPKKGWGYGHPRMIVLPAAASSKEGWQMFHRNSDNMCSSLNKLGDTQPCGKVVEEYPIATVRLQSILSRIPPHVMVEFIKIDAQGHDLEVVKGIGQDMIRTKVKHIIMEVQSTQIYQQGSTRQSVLSYMESCGWKLAMDTNNGSSNEQNLAFDNTALVTAEESKQFWAQHRI